MKKRLITLLLAVIMVMSLLPMSALAYDYEGVKGHKATYVILSGSKVVKHASYNGEDGYPIDLKLSTNDDMLYIVEPGTKINIKAMNSAGSLAIKPLAPYTKGLTTWDHTGYLKENGGAFDQAVVGEDYVVEKVEKGLFKYNKTIKIPNTAKTSAFMVTGEFGTSGAIITILICRDTNSVVEYARANCITDHNELNTESRNQYPVYFSVLTDYGTDDGSNGLFTNELPAEPSVQTYTYAQYSTEESYGLFTGWKHYYSHDLKPGEFAPYGGAHGVNERNNTGAYTTNPNDPVIVENIGARKDFVTSVDGSNTRAIVDYSGKRTKEVTNLCFDYVAEGTKNAQGNTIISQAKGILDQMAVKVGKTPKYHAINGVGITEANVSEFKLIPYVVKFETTSVAPGWHIDSAVVPKDWVPLQYNLNLGDGYSIDGVKIPNAYYGMPTFKTTVKTFQIVDGDKTVDKAVNDVIKINNDKAATEDEGAVTVQRKFLGWSTDPNATTAEYKPDDPIYVPKNATPECPDGEGVTLYGVWGAEIKATTDDGAKVSVDNGTAAKEVTETVPVKAESYSKVNIELEDGYVIDKITVDDDPIDGYTPAEYDDDGNVTGGDEPIWDGDKYNAAVKNGYVEVERDGNHTVKVTTSFEGYYIYHSSTKTTESVKLSDSNIVDHVEAGYLYAGYYGDEDYENPYSENGTEFTPVKGRTYYLKEISDYYARPVAFVTYRTGYANPPLTRVNIATALDGSYKEAGFVFNTNGKTEIKKISAFTEHVKLTHVGEKEPYANYSFKPDGNKTFFSTLSKKINAGELVDPQKGAGAVQALVNVTPQVADNTYVTVYFVTPDDVTVYSNAVRLIGNPNGTKNKFTYTTPEGVTYDGKWNGIADTSGDEGKDPTTPGTGTDTPTAAKNLVAPFGRNVSPQAIKNIARNMAASNTATAENGSTIKLIPIYDSITISDSGSDEYGNIIETPTITPVENNTDVPEEPEVPEVPETPETPETPDVPETPDAPETPDVPETPDEPENADVTVKVNVNGQVTEVKGEKGDYTAKIETPKQDNKIFAGWYTDEECTIPADLTNVKENVTLYAKFINASDVKVSTIKTSLLKNNFRTIVSAKGEFESASFVCKVDGKEITVNGAKKADGFVGDWSANTKLISKVVITPTFMTEDGTMVYGNAKTFTYVLGLFI